MQKLVVKENAEDCVFYIPKQETLRKVRYNEPLSREEIDDYMTYVVNNYYVSEDKKELISFVINWTKNITTKEEMNNSIQTAYKSLIRTLSKGEPIDFMDILWVSENIFIDGDDMKGRRNITKKVVDGKPILNVESQYTNPKIESRIDRLKTELRNKIIEKPVANNL